MICPCCKQAVDTLPPTGLPQLVGSFLASNALEKLSRCYPNAVPAGALVEAMYHGAREADTSRQRVRDVLARLRKDLAAYGWTITYPHRGRGSRALYRLERMAA